MASQVQRTLDQEQVQYVLSGTVDAAA